MRATSYLAAATALLLGACGPKPGDGCEKPLSNTITLKDGTVIQADSGPLLFECEANRRLALFQAQPGSDGSGGGSEGGGGGGIGGGDDGNDTSRSAIVEVSIGGRSIGLLPGTTFVEVLLDRNGRVADVNLADLDMIDFGNYDSPSEADRLVVANLLNRRLSLIPAQQNFITIRALASGRIADVSVAELNLVSSRRNSSLVEVRLGSRVIGLVPMQRLIAIGVDPDLKGAKELGITAEVSKPAPGSAKAAVGGAIGSTTSAIGDVGSAVGGAVDGLGDTVDDLGDTLSDTLGGVGETLGGLLN